MIYAGSSWRPVKASATKPQPNRCFHCGAPMVGKYGHGTRRVCIDCEPAYQNAKNRAHYRLERLIDAGHVPAIDGQKCVDCGKPAEFYDIRDYRKPAAVSAICRSCNNLRGPGVFKDG